MKTPKDVYEALGRDRIQRELGLTPASLTDAIADGKFPARWYARIKALADADGVALPLALFSWRKSGQTYTPEDAIRRTREIQEEGGP